MTNKKLLIIAVAISLVFSSANSLINKVSAVDLNTDPTSAVTAELKPDFYIEDLRLDTPNPKVGEQVLFSAKFKNIGEAAITQWSVKHENNANPGTSIGTYFTEIEPGGYAIYPGTASDTGWISQGGFVVYESTGAGEYTFEITLDPYDDLNELNEDNNYKSITIYVGPKEEPALSPVEEPVTIEQPVIIYNPNVKHKIAYWWGKVNMHTEDGRWVTDPDGTSGANIDRYTYCKKWYSTTQYAIYDGREYVEGFTNAGGTGWYFENPVTYHCTEMDVVSDYENQRKLYKNNQPVSVSLNNQDVNVQIEVSSLRRDFDTCGDSRVLFKFKDQYASRYLCVGDSDTVQLDSGKVKVTLDKIIHSASNKYAVADVVAIDDTPAITPIEEPTITPAPNYELKFYLKLDGNANDAVEGEVPTVDTGIQFETNSISGKSATAPDNNIYAQYSCDGNVDYNNGSVSLWVNFPEQYPATDMVFFHTDDSQLVVGYDRISSNGSKRVYGRRHYPAPGEGSFYIYKADSTSLNAPVWGTNEWHHLVMTWDGVSGTTNFYVDGVLSESKQYTSSDTGCSTFRILNNYWPGQNFDYGLLDELRIYNYPLTAGQVNQLYNNEEPITIEQPVIIHQPTEEQNRIQRIKNIFRHIKDIKLYQAPRVTTKVVEIVTQSGQEYLLYIIRGDYFGKDGDVRIGEKWLKKEVLFRSDNLIIALVDPSVTGEVIVTRARHLSEMLDTDRDGLPDDWEKILGSNPNNSDSDGDGYEDGIEVENQYDPNLQMQKYTEVDLSDVE